MTINSSKCLRYKIRMNNKTNKLVNKITKKLNKM